MLLVAVLLLSPGARAPAPVDPGVVLPARDRIVATDGRVLERGPDGYYREVAAAATPGGPARPFDPGVLTPGTVAPAVSTSRPPEPVRGSSAAPIATGPTTTYAPLVGFPGSTSGCPPSG